MVQDYYEDFVRLMRVRRPDGYGGVSVSWVDGESLRAGLIPKRDKGASLGEQPAIHTTYAMLHDRAIDLCPGDRLRRVRDGAVFRITGHSADGRTPRDAGISCAQVTAERLVNAS